MAKTITTKSILIVGIDKTPPNHYTLWGNPVGEPGTTLEIQVYRTNPGGIYNICNTNVPTYQRVTLFGGTPDAYSMITQYIETEKEHLLIYAQDDPFNTNVFQVLCYSTLNSTVTHPALHSADFSDWGSYTWTAARRAPTESTAVVERIAAGVVTIVSLLDKLTKEHEDEARTSEQPPKRANGDGAQA